MAITGEREKRNYGGGAFVVGTDVQRGWFVEKKSDLDRVDHLPNELPTTDILKCLTKCGIVTSVGVSGNQRGAWHGSGFDVELDYGFAGALGIPEIVRVVAVDGPERWSVVMGKLTKDYTGGVVDALEVMATSFPVVLDRGVTGECDIVADFVLQLMARRCVTSFYSEREMLGLLQQIAPDTYAVFLNSKEKLLQNGRSIFSGCFDGISGAFGKYCTAAGLVRPAKYDPYLRLDDFEAVPRCVTVAKEREDTIYDMSVRRKKGVKNNGHRRRGDN